MLATVAHRCPRLACCVRPAAASDSAGGEESPHEDGFVDDYGLAIRSAATLFALLATKTTASHLRTAAAEALHTLAAALVVCRAEDAKGNLDSDQTIHGAAHATLVPLRRLLWSMSRSSDYRARHCVVTWADQAAWGRGEPAATYLLSCLASDPHNDVRDAASHALEAIGAPEEATMSSESSPVREPIASFIQFVNFAVTGGEGSPALHTLPHRVQASAIEFAMTALQRIQSIDGPLHEDCAALLLCEVSPVVGTGLVLKSSYDTAFALKSASLSSMSADTSQPNNSSGPFLAAFEDLVESANRLLDEAAYTQQQRADGDWTEVVVPSVVASDCLLLCLKACSQALQLNALTGESTQTLWCGLSGRLLRKFAGNIHRFAALVGHASEVTNLSHLSAQSGSVCDSGSIQVGRATSDAITVAISKRCAEILGVLAPFAPSVVSERLLVAATAVLNTEDNARIGLATQRSVVSRGNSALGARRSAVVSALTTIGALVQALHVSYTSLEKIKQAVATEIMEGASDDAVLGVLSCKNLARSVHGAVATAAGWVGCNDTEVHLAAACAITRSATFHVPLPSLGMDDHMDDHMPLAPGSALNAHPSPPAQQYSSIEAAAAAGDRDAVRSLMQRRDGAVAAPEPPQSPAMGFGAGWTGDLWQKCATLANTHAEDTQRAGAAAAALATTAASPFAKVRSAAISALLTTANRNDPDFAFAVGFALAVHALAAPAYADSHSVSDQSSPVGSVLVLDAVLRGPMQDSSPMVRRNGATWLLAILVAAPPALAALHITMAGGSNCSSGSLSSNTTSMDAEVKAFLLQGWLERIPILQKCFLKLLLDRRQSEFGKEVAALGLAATAKAAQTIDNGVMKNEGEETHKVRFYSMYINMLRIIKYFAFRCRH